MLYSTRIKGIFNRQGGVRAMLTLLVMLTVMAGVMLWQAPSAAAQSVPAAPANLTDGTVTHNSAEVSWDDPSDTTSN